MKPRVVRPPREMKPRFDKGVRKSVPPCRINGRTITFDLDEIQRRLKLGTLSEEHRRIYRGVFGCDPTEVPDADS